MKHLLAANPRAPDGKPPFTIADLRTLRAGAMRAARRGFPVKACVAFARDANRRAVRLALAARRASGGGQVATPHPCMRRACAPTGARRSPVYRFTVRGPPVAFTGTSSKGEVRRSLLAGSAGSPAGQAGASRALVGGPDSAPCRHRSPAAAPLAIALADRPCRGHVLV
jgi:hypothetical protein